MRIDSSWDWRANVLIASDAWYEIDLIASEAGYQVWREQLRPEYKWGRKQVKQIASEFIANEEISSEADSKWGWLQVSR